MKTKQCNKCRGTYPLTSQYFHKDSKGGEGFSRMCKRCRSTYRKQDKKTREAGKLFLKYLETKFIARACSPLHHLPGYLDSIANDLFPQTVYTKMFTKQKGYCALCCKHQINLKKPLESNAQYEVLLCKKCKKILKKHLKGKKFDNYTTQKLLKIVRAKNGTPQKPEEHGYKYIGCSNLQLTYGGHGFEDPRGVLKKGQTYHLDFEPEIHDWHTVYYIDGKKYNSVCFEKVG